MPFVYLHRRFSGEVYYVGKGTQLDRCYTKHGRNKKWKEINQDPLNFNVQTVEVASEQLASELEQLIIDECKTLINKKKTSDERLDYSAVNWSQLVKYDKNSPTFLTYLVDNECKNPKYKKYKGEPAGYTRKVKGKNCASKLEHKGKTYAVHRIIWVLFNGEIPKDLVVNHIDCNPSNNHIENLELCSIRENNERKRVHVYNESKSSSGLANIQFVERIGKKKIRVSITLNKVKYRKQFCADTIGFDCALDLAKDYLKKIKDKEKNHAL